MATEQTANQTGGTDLDAEVIVIGAGVSGIHQLHLLREAGFDVKLIEAGTNVGGTWYWNRYPGARFDSESYSYGYFFSPELLAEWNWAEHFAPAYETEAYLNFATDRLGLRDLMRFRTRVAGATFDETSATWTLVTEDGEQLRSRFVVSATGVLSIPYWPAIPGRDRFRGEAHHTGQWPKDPVDFKGKRVAVIGTGASAVQLIPEVAKEVGELVVYQRTPNWNSPLNNGPITDEEQAELKATYDKIHAACMSTFGGFVHLASRKKAFDESKDERLALYEKLYHQKGFAKLLSNYRDLMINPEVNAEFSEFLADKIRGRVHDKALAEKLIPTDHGFGMRRPPMETFYFEAFNQPNVRLIDLNETPITSITEAGIETTAGEEAFDIIVWATGFDGFTGALTRINPIGEGGMPLKERWADGVVTLLAVAVPGMPNFFTAGGPHMIGANFPRATEVLVDFITAILVHARDKGLTYVAAEPEASAGWTEEVHEAGNIALIAEHTWFRGTNIPGKKAETLQYTGNLSKFRARLDNLVEQGFPGFSFGTRVPA